MSIADVSARNAPRNASPTDLGAAIVCGFPLPVLSARVLCLVLFLSAVWPYKSLAPW